MADVTNIEDVLASVDEAFAPRIVASVNEWAVKIAKVRGEYVWHSHPETDELFIVMSGELTIARREPQGEVEVVLGPRDVHVVPRGMEHKPSSAAGASIMMLEPAATLSTGDYAGVIPAHITPTTGVTAVAGR